MKTQKILKRILHIYMLHFAYRFCRLTRILSGIIGLIALGFVCFEVVGRYFAPHILTDWGPEVTIYLIIWALFLSVGDLPLTNGHVSANFLVDRVSNRRKFEILASLAGLCFSILLLWYGYEVVKFAHFIGEEGDSTLRFPKWIYYLALPTGLLIQSLGYIIHIYISIKDPNYTHVSEIDTQNEGN